jgi:hypothetical protein
MARQKVVHDAGKGYETLRNFTASVYLQNGTVVVPLGQCPAEICITRVLVGSKIATAVTSIDVMALASGTALDTAPATGNRLITTITTIDASKSLVAATLNHANSDKVAADSEILVSIAAGSAPTTAPVFVQVEYDVIGRTYGGYDEGDASAPTYPSGTVL